MDSKTIFNQALRYHALGWSIIPVGQEKKPLISWKQYQQKQATAQKIEEWTLAFPNMNIGVVTGELSGILIIDVEAGGDISQFPPTAMSKTGGGGWHLFYKYPNVPISNSTRKLAPLTDVRASGGYAVLPPSIHASGKAYEWVTPPENGLAEIPQDLLKRLTDNSKPQAELQTETNNAGDVPQGERNDTATKFIGRVLHYIPQDLWESVGWVTLRGWNANHANPPLAESELRLVFTSIKEREQKARDGSAEPINFTPFTLTDLYKEDFPAAKWVVQDLVPLGTIVALTGDANSYKTFLTQSMAACVATGTPFLDHFTTIPGKVLIVDEENHRMHIKDRFKQMGVNATSDISFLSLNGIKIDNPEHLAHLKELIEKEKPVLVILDSLIRLHGGEENSASEMSIAFSAMKKLVSDDRAILFIHHHRKPQGFGKKSGSQSIRGSSDIIAAVDSHIAIDRKGSDFIVTQTKMRLQPEIKPFMASLAPTIEGNYVFIYRGEDTSEKDQMQEICETLINALEQSSMLLSVDMLEEETKLPKSKIRQALKELVKSGDVIIAAVGPHGEHFFGLPQARLDSGTI
ncbi:MAG: AAA family ATPase [Candidatus Staskawiczbacteria bacterium]|nr:AAA family ATPase [Candidatus Staskawiczbacteria bacterium]